MRTFESESRLAGVLDRTLVAPGSADMEPEVADLVSLAHVIGEASAQIAPREEFRLQSRQRLLAHMARTAPPAPSVRDRVRVWAARLFAALAAVGISGVAAAGASANAAPGDPLYPVRQVAETAVHLGALLPAAPARSDVTLTPVADEKLAPWRDEAEPPAPAEKPEAARSDVTLTPVEDEKPAARREEVVLPPPAAERREAAREEVLPSPAAERREAAREEVLPPPAAERREAAREETPAANDKAAPRRAISATDRAPATPRARPEKR